LGRFGRRRFTIKHCDEAAARRRADAMSEMAGVLVKAGHAERAPVILTRAAEAEDRAEFDRVRKAAAGLAAGRLVPDEMMLDGAATTFRMVGERWVSGRLHRDFPDHVKAKKDTDSDEHRLDKLYAIDVGGCTLGDVAISEFRLEHAERAMQRLPENAKRRNTRRAYALIIRRVLTLAVYPLKLIPANPLPPQFVPKVEKPPAYPFLYPAEDAALMACAEVPIWQRLVFGFLAREGMRASEALALRWRDVDLNLGTVTLDENKTDDARAWTLDRGIVAALKAWRKRYCTQAETDDLVFTEDGGRPVVVEGLAKLLRANLKTAGVSRPELFNEGKNRGVLRAHDLRGTFITLALANGKTETWVADRTGHRSSQMINRYRRQARTAAELRLGWLARLDQVIPELRPKRPARKVGHGKARRRRRSGPRGGPRIARPAGFEPATSGLENRPWSHDGRACFVQLRGAGQGRWDRQRMPGVDMR